MSWSRKSTLSWLPLLLNSRRSFLESPLGRNFEELTRGKAFHFLQEKVRNIRAMESSIDRCSILFTYNAQRPCFMIFYNIPVYIIFYKAQFAFYIARNSILFYIKLIKSCIYIKLYKYWMSQRISHIFKKWLLY